MRQANCPTKFRAERAGSSPGRLPKAASFFLQEGAMAMKTDPADTLDDLYRGKADEAA